MLCPSCGEKNPLGAAHCLACGYAFTRAEHERQYPGQPSRDWEPANRERPYPERSQMRQQRGRGARWVFFILILLVAGAAAVVAGMALTDGIIKPYVAGRISGELDQGIREAVQNEIGINSLPEQASSGEVTITEQQINERVAAHALAGPLDQATVDLRPAGIAIDLEAYGLSGTYRADLVVVDGQVQLRNGSIDGALGMILPTGELEDVTNAAIGSSLNQAGYHVEDLQLSDSAIVLSYQR